MSAEDNANIVRWWAAETHVLPPVVASWLIAPWLWHRLVK